MAHINRKAALAAFFISMSIPAWGAVYYVDSRAGSDANTGLSAEQPWRTLARVAQSRLGAGDYVLLKRGEVWREQLLVTASGTEGARLTYGAYGTGSAPVIDGQGVYVPADGGLVTASMRSFIAFDGLEVRNSASDGINLYSGIQLVVRNSVVHHNQRNGIHVYNGSFVAVENCRIHDNSLDLSDSFSGVRFDAGSAEQKNFLIANNEIYGNAGGDDWYSGNGIALGHTGPDTPTLRNVVIAGNNVHHNGNPKQNQAGRGIRANIHGEASVVRNFIHHNASAGMYLGDYGTALKIEISQNVFVDNALRQFGGYTELSAEARNNLMWVSDPSIVGMGVEIGGRGAWNLQENVFAFTTPTDDTYRGFIRLNDAMQEEALQSDFNVFYSAGPQRWVRSDSVPVPFSQWQTQQRDRHSVSLR